MDDNQLETALKQKAAEAAASAEERDTLRNKLQLLQDQILHGDGSPKKVCSNTCRPQPELELCSSASNGLVAVLVLGVSGAACYC